MSQRRVFLNLLKVGVISLVSVRIRMSGLCWRIAMWMAVQFVLIPLQFKVPTLMWVAGDRWLSMGLRGGVGG